jgi:hypothetical protein
VQEFKATSPRAYIEAVDAPEVVDSPTDARWHLFTGSSLSSALPIVMPGGDALVATPVGLSMLVVPGGGTVLKAIEQGSPYKLEPVRALLVEPADNAPDNA